MIEAAALARLTTRLAAIVADRRIAEDVLAEIDACGYALCPKDDVATFANDRAAPPPGD